MAWVLWMTGFFLCVSVFRYCGNFTLVFVERYSAFLRPVHFAKRCVTLFLDVQLHVLHLGPSSWRMAWLVFFGCALLSHPVTGRGPTAIAWVPGSRCTPDEHGSSTALHPRTPHHHLHGSVPRACSSLAHASLINLSTIKTMNTVSSTTCRVIASCSVHTAASVLHLVVPLA